MRVDKDGPATNHRTDSVEEGRDHAQETAQPPGAVGQAGPLDLDALFRVDLDTLEETDWVTAADLGVSDELLCCELGDLVTPHRGEGGCLVWSGPELAEWLPVVLARLEKRMPPEDETP